LSITDPIGREGPHRWMLLYYSRRREEVFFHPRNSPVNERQSQLSHKRTHAAHKGKALGVPGSGDWGDCAVGHHRTSSAQGHYFQDRERQLTYLI